MSDTGTLLPTGFAGLEAFAVAWAAEGTAQRANLRHMHGAEERRAFFDAAKDMLIPALDYLDAKSFAHMDENDRRLMNMMLSLAHVTMAIEGLGEDEDRHALSSRHMKITRSTADTDNQIAVQPPSTA